MENLTLNSNHRKIEYLDEKLEEINGNEDLKSISMAYSENESTLMLNGKPSFLNDQKKNYNKQSSLDSKIEHIFDIINENEIDPNYNSLLNRSQPNPERRNSKELNNNNNEV
jgi:hypothetical protein